MPTVHFLNVGEGDCSIIQHGSGRVSVIDICNGKTALQRLVDEAAAVSGIGKYAARGGGNYGMKNRPTDPVAYLRNLGVSSVFRFILTHPDMDHLDGFECCGYIVEFRCLFVAWEGKDAFPLGELGIQVLDSFL